MTVADIRIGATDSAGAIVETVFAHRSPLYAVYRTKDRLLIHFADDPVEEEIQRKAIAYLGPLRGHINGLIDGWRTGHDLADRAKASAFERRVADALIVAMEGQPETAKLLLEDIKADAYDVRVSRARFLYLIAACLTLLITVIPILVVTSDWYARSVFPFGSYTSPLWLAAASGAFGAFFSIAIGIRNRTVLPDLRTGDNSADAVLRVVIGVIAATVLIFLLQSGVVGTPTFGNRTVELGAKAPAIYSWTMVVVVAFVAGFLERLVPDLLADNAISALKSAKPTAPVPPPPPASRPMAVQRVQAPGEDEDNCVDRHSAVDDTPDEELPAARGGVANV